MNGGRRHRRSRVLVLATTALGIALVALVAYSSYVGIVGSGAVTDPTGSTDCRTPLEQFGWSYEAINYDPADDDRLRAAYPDMTDCGSHGSTAGEEVVTSDGVPIAGWYVPAANGVGPTGPTIVMAHGWDAGKSDILRYGRALHATYNLVAFDQRNHGRSGGVQTTLGYKEWRDVEAIVDWLVDVKGTSHIGVLANSMGSPALLAAAVGDPRIEAVLLDSAHANLLTLVAARLPFREGQPAYPGAWSIVLGSAVRVGADVTEVDPARLIPRLGDRPLLLTHGTADLDDVPRDSAEVNRLAAENAGVDVTLRYCEGAEHAEVVDVCPESFGRWATMFFASAFDRGAARGPVAAGRSGADQPLRPALINRSRASVPISPVVRPTTRPSPSSITKKG
jgi:pimeloyl-ACP methyl ester carboxylesterase